MYNLYAEAWERLRQDRLSCGEIDCASTPVLAFGQWRSARIVTAGLNPSEDEFRDKWKGALEGDKQRFLHWPADGKLTEDRFKTACSRAEGYFTLGNVYDQWFDLYRPFLSALGTSFEEGSACHTDYLSPFATATGISKCCGLTRTRLQTFGLTFWRKVLDALPNMRLLFGHGGGWKKVPPLFGFDTVDWELIPTRFDSKGGDTSIQRPFLLFRRARLSPPKKEIGVFWWRPNRDGSPLTWLNNSEKNELGEIVRDISMRNGLFD